MQIENEVSFDVSPHYADFVFLLTINFVQNLPNAG